MRGLALLLLFGCASLAGAAPPNFVVIFIDDLGYGDLGCYGNPSIRTPNLDRMAREGLRLTSFYAASNCSPSRAQLLTGRYSARAGVPRVLGAEATEGLAGSEVTLAEALKTKGYRTACFGKWHLGFAKPEFLPTAQGFDEYFGLLYSNDMAKPWGTTDKPLRLWRNDRETPEDPVDQTTLTKRYTDEAIRFMTEARDGPFFLYVPHTMMHVPIFASEEFRGKSRRGLYGDALEELDANVGRLLAAIDQLKLAEKTLVLFTSDNGPWMGLPDRKFRGGIEATDVGTAGLLRGWKATTYEGGQRVACIFKWPGRIAPGTASAEPASTLDILPTFLALAGIAPPPGVKLDGWDIAAFLEGKTQESPRKEFFYLLNGKTEGVREGRWKYRLGAPLGERDAKPEDFEPELFDLEFDPSEQFNLAEREPEIAARLRAKMDAMAAELAAK